MSFMAGNAIKGAAERALASGRTRSARRAPTCLSPAPDLALRPETGASDPNITYGYCAQVAEVEVDLDTGHVHVLRLISANDVGRAVNPQQVEGQIEGAVAQSMGWTLLEKYMQRDGRAVTQHFSTYLIPGVLDVPTVVEPIILEFPDPQGPLANCAAWRRCPSSQLRPPSLRRDSRRHRLLDRRTALHAGTGVGGAAVRRAPAGGRVPSGAGETGAAGHRRPAAHGRYAAPHAGYGHASSAPAAA
jgi:hypothetical protein